MLLIVMMEQTNIDCLADSSHGIVLVNKPQGPSSHRVANLVKKIYQVKKAGHAGALDPLATGMLPIFLGEATKYVQYLLNADKVYRATGLLGVNTTTGDAWGDVIQRRDAGHISSDALLSVLQGFKGAQLQIPPMYSALKHQGRPLYQLARQGIHVERPARSIVIHTLELIDFNDAFFTIQVACSKGTYIRTLIQDIGESLQVGAHMTALHRLSTGGFSPDSMHHLSELSDECLYLQHYLLPVDRVLMQFPMQVLSDAECLMIRQGKGIASQTDGDTVRLYAGNQTFVGLGEVVEGLLRAKRLMRF